jgi:hypothetical protein
VAAQVTLQHRVQQFLLGNETPTPTSWEHVFGRKEGDQIVLSVYAQRVGTLMVPQWLLRRAVSRASLSAG